MNNIHVEKIQEKEFEQVALILANAFETNAAYSLIFNHTNKLREGLLWLFKTNLYLLNRRQTVTNVIKESNSNSIIGTFSLVPPEGEKNSLSDYLPIGLPGFILKFGIKSLFKMLKMRDMNKSVLEKSIQAKAYYYLSMVVIKEEYRGKGIGSFAVKKQLNELSETDKNRRIVGLTTQLPENVMFYSRLGFKNIGEGYIIFKENKYYNWNMKFVF
ncbi:MAG: GNAT family N-acetyltransferase [Prevotellaceae bacterium]|nr:GNAT family N-acetyltransferase [Prevotellaceae bacterium]